MSNASGPLGDQGDRDVELRQAVARRRKDPKFRARLQRIIEEDRELLERLEK